MKNCLTTAFLYNCLLIIAIQMVIMLSSQLFYNFRALIFSSREILGAG